MKQLLHMLCLNTDIWNLLFYDCLLKVNVLAFLPRETSFPSHPQEFILVLFSYKHATSNIRDSLGKSLTH